MTGPYGSTAHRYHDLGWKSPLPVQGKHLNLPSGYTGKDGIEPGAMQIARWVNDRGVDNICLRMPPDVIGIDVDGYNGKHGNDTWARACDEWGSPGATWTSTSRDDGSGIRFYRVPPNTRWPSSFDRIFGEASHIDIIKREHRYAVVWPSVHPHTSATYQWRKPDGELANEPPAVSYLPYLAERWIEGLTASARAERSASAIEANDDSHIARVRMHAETAIAGANRNDTGFELVRSLRDNWCTLDDAVTVWMPLYVQFLGPRANEPGSNGLPYTVEEAQETARSAFGGPGAPELATTDQRRAADGMMKPATQPLDTGRARFGGEFILDEPANVASVWGDGENVLWAEGEGLMLTGHQGVGKTTIGQQLVLHRIGIRSGDFLGLPVHDDGRRLLYLAMDRPRQAARSFRRMVSESDRLALNERLVVWRGPLPVNILDKHTALADFCEEICPGLGTLVIDSTKDLAPGLVKDEVGSAINLAWQEVIARNVELVTLHHERKAEGGASRSHKLDDVYGSSWLTAGLGSVIVLVGEPGDPSIELHHLKQPANPVGPLNVRHEHSRGVTQLFAALDLLGVVRMAGDTGISARDAAAAVIGRTAESDVKATKRALEKLERDKQIGRIPGQATSGGRTPDRWALTSEMKWALDQPRPEPLDKATGQRLAL